MRYSLRYDFMATAVVKNCSRVASKQARNCPFVQLAEPLRLMPHWDKNAGQPTALQRKWPAPVAYAGHRFTFESSYRPLCSGSFFSGAGFGAGFGAGAAFAGFGAGAGLLALGALSCGALSCGAPALGALSLGALSFGALSCFAAGAGFGLALGSLSRAFGSERGAFSLGALSLAFGAPSRELALVAGSVRGLLAGRVFSLRGAASLWDSLSRVEFE